jgi:hypothetical protein
MSSSAQALDEFHTLPDPDHFVADGFACMQCRYQIGIKLMANA